MDAQPDQIAYVALGANLGDRAANIRRALDLLDDGTRVRVLAVSNLLENPAVGGPPGAGAFLNGVAKIETSLAPEPLLDRLLEIEHTLGRVRRQRWEPRIIDLDLLLYGSQVVSTPRLTVPHPLMHERRFVLQPLAELAPDLVHPVRGLSIRELLEGLGSTG